MTSNFVREGPLHDEHIKYLVRQAHAIGVPAHEVDDVVQETLLKAVELMPAFRGDAKKTTWLYKILLNVWRNDHRRIARRVRKHHNYEAEYRAAEPSKILRSEFYAELSLAISELREFVESLAPDEREAFVARTLRGLGRAEAASLLGIEPAVLDRRFGSANLRFDDHFEHRHRSPRHIVHAPAKRQRPGRFGIWAPIVQWGNSTTGALLSMFACVAAGLWLIAATTPDVRPRQVVAKKPMAQSRPSLAPTPDSGAAVEVVTPIVVKLDRRQAGSASADPTAVSDLSESTALNDTAHLARGRELRYENDLEEALAQIRAIDSHGPLARERWGNEVGILCEMERFGEAKAVTSQWLAMHPDDLTHLSRSCVSQEWEPHEP